MSQYSIRDFRDNDYNHILQLWKDTGLGGAERGDDLEVIQNTISNGGALFVMETDNHEVVGTAWLTNDSRRLYLHHLGIRADYQNKGLGRMLTDYCICWAGKTNLQLKLEVHINNKNAIHLYEKTGFKRLGDYDVFIIRNYENTDA